MRHNSSVPFYLKFYILSTKRAYQSTNFAWAVKSLKFCTLVGSFCKNDIKFQLKKYRKLIAHDIEEWCKVYRKTDSLFQIWHEEFGQFSPNHSKVQKIHFDGLFCPKYKRFELKKNTEKLNMTLKSEAKFE